MRNYIIVTPSYGKSAGVRALHLLADELANRGYSVKLFSYRPYLEKYEYVEDITEEMQQNDIVIYPESVAGNPLGFHNVVRWVLYYPGKLGGESSYHHSEKIFTWSKIFYSDVPELSLSLIDKNLFYNDSRPKKHDSYFVYKGGQCRIIPEIENAIRIDMHYPKEREELGELLRNTETLYSYDANSTLLDEAVICGAKVKIITEEDIYDFKSNIGKLDSAIEENVNTFIEMTQKMNYKGEIQPPISNIFRRLLYKFRVLSGYIFKNHKKIFRYKLRY